MKVYAIYVKYYDIEAEVPDGATPEEIYDAVNDKIESLSDADLLDAEYDEIIKEITDENDNYIWEE